MFRLAPSKALGRLPNNTNFSSVFRRSISTEPLLQNPDHFRVLRISNVPSGTPVSVLLDQIRVDGPIENIRYNEADNSATLSLLDAQAAKKLMNESDSININGQTLSFEFAPAELQHKLSASLLGSIGGYFTTRAVEIELRPGATEEWYRTEVERLCGPVEIERIVLDNTNSKAFLYFTDLLEAVKAKQIFKNNGMRADKVRSVMDPCDFNNSEDARETHTVIIKDVENGPVRKLLFEHISGASGGFLSNVPLNSLFRSKDNVVMLDFINSSDARQFVEKFSHPQWSAELDPRPRNATTYKRKN
ncbi:hypothetical protein K435DRAFT_328882 [Dendrothele bispora CBS 962.96]|uniref:RRM domain-containing protein n=1 Tax=Dendrothele bispora (strain CBS 962.96) TaxID=1314807 RepID=A0A4S8MVD6_DENBC|nr:hypothetical protein K435DRAFT_328882 [Dendrothele bispora CBS 962.96]